MALNIPRVVSLRLRTFFRSPEELRTRGGESSAVDSITLLEQRVLLANALGDAEQIGNVSGSATTRVLANGDVMFAWEDAGRLYRQRFSSDAVALTNVEDLGATAADEIVLGTDGGVVTLWVEEQSSGPLPRARLQGRRYAANGTAGTVFTAATADYLIARHVSAALTSSGHLVIMYADFYEASYWVDYAIRLDTANNETHRHDLTNGPNGNFEYSGYAAELRPDDSVVLARAKEEGFSEYRSIGNVIEADGTWDGSEISLGDDYIRSDWVAGPGGSLYRAYAENSAVYLDHYAADGTEIEVRRRVGTGSRAQVAVSSEGRVVVAWSGDFSTDVFGQVYSAAGVEVGQEFRIGDVVSGTAVRLFHLEFTGDETFRAYWNETVNDNVGTYSREFDVGGASTLGSSEETTANTTTAGNQSQPAVAVNASGRTVIVWQGPGENGLDIFAQIFDADGNPSGDEFVVNTTTAGDQSDPAVAINADGTIVVAWTGIDADGTGVFAQRFNQFGVALGGEFRANSYEAGTQSNAAVAIRPDGSFMIFWQSAGQDGSGTGVYTQRFRANGTTLGSELRVNEQTSLAQYHPTATSDADGVVTVAWVDLHSSGGVLARRFAANGVPLTGESLLSDTDARTPHVASNASGQAVVAWMARQSDGSYRVLAQRLLSDGTSLGAPIAVHDTTSDQRTPAAAVTESGSFVVTWADDSGSGWEVMSRAYRRTGAPLGEAVRLNTVTTGDQRFPTVGIDASGRFVTAWRSDGQDGDGLGVYARQQTLGRQTIADDIIVRESGRTWRRARYNDGPRFDMTVLGRWSSTQDWQTTQYADFNGDGLIDVASRASNGMWWVGLNNGTNLATSAWSRWSTTATWNDLSFGDFNGDGMADVIGRSQSGQWWIGYSDGTRFNTQAASRWSGTENWQTTQYADFDGNGTTDVASRAGNGMWWVGLTEVNPNPGKFSTSAWSRWSTGTNWHDIAATDVDGDGRADVVGRTDSGMWWIGASDGTAFDTRAAGSWSDIGGTNGANTAVVGDFNGDGYSDLASLAAGLWHVSLYNEATGRFVDEDSPTTLWADWSQPDASWLPVPDWDRPVVGDFNGDGLDDVAAFDAGTYDDFQAGFSRGNGFAPPTEDTFLGRPLDDIGTGHF